MKKEEIQPWDIQRILFGQAPVEFLLEVFIRTIIIYICLLIVLRLLGKRMDGQLTLTEMAVMIMLGAIVSVPSQMPERGMLVGIIALLCVLIFQRSLNWIAIKNEPFENATLGTMSILVKDGLLQLDEMHKAGISKQNLFSTLRGNKIYNLGRVKRVYFEACGIINVYIDEVPKPGLPTIPSKDLDLIKDHARIDNGNVACINCGYINAPNSKSNTCQNCGANQWISAVL